MSDVNSSRSAVVAMKANELKAKSEGLKELLLFASVVHSEPIFFIDSATENYLELKPGNVEK